MNICQGSRKIIDATNHMTYVEPKDTMIVKNVELVNRSVKVKPSCCTSVWIDFTVTKMQANAK